MSDFEQLQESLVIELHKDKEALIVENTQLRKRIVELEKENKAYHPIR